MNFLKKTLLAAFISLTLIACSQDYLAKEYRAETIFKDPQVLELTLAAKEGNTQKIDRLINQGVDVNAEGERGYTPLYWIFSYVSPNSDTKKGFAHLLKNGANPTNTPQETGIPLLHFTAKADDSDYLKLILENSKNVDINLVHKSLPSWEETPLMMSITAGGRTFKNFELLLEYGADMEQTNSNGETALQDSTSSGKWNYALYLLEKGADYTVGSNKAYYNIEGQPEIIRSLERGNYFDHLKERPEGETSDRDKVIKFLEDKGLKFYPYHREDDPRYNPKPPLPEKITTALKKWDECDSLIKSNDHSNWQVREFKDVGLYKDISPHNYSRESERIFGLAVINLIKLHHNGHIGIIKAEFFGRDQDVYSNYYFDGKHPSEKLMCVLKTQDIYDKFKSQKGSKIERSVKKLYVVNNDSCYLEDDIEFLKELDSSECENFRLDAQTYKRAVK